MRRIEFTLQPKTGRAEAWSSLMADVEKITIIYDFDLLGAAEKYAADIAQLARVKNEKETREKTIISLDIVKVLITLSEKVVSELELAKIAAIKEIEETAVSNGQIRTQENLEDLKYETKCLIDTITASKSGATPPTEGAGSSNSEPIIIPDTDTQVSHFCQIQTTASHAEKKVISRKNYLVFDLENPIQQGDEKINHLLVAESLKEEF
ncbi:2326_t:CDS:2, partial [Ambispora gerdemannii]